MTELAIIKGFGVIATGVLIEAVIDPSIASISLALIAGAVVIIPVWFKYKTDTMIAKLKEHDVKLSVQDVKIAEVVKTSDGMKTELVKFSERAGYAEGALAGSVSAENKANAVAAAKATGAAEAASQAHKE